MSTTLPTVPAGDPDSLLDAERRTRDIHRCASSTVDVLVVGGGITGVGIALDAATRGLSVALVEAHDLAYGTSRWSSKLVHGGLRYLASGQVGIAWESAVERTRIMNTIAPHLARPMAQLVPMFDDSRGYRWRPASGWVTCSAVARVATCPRRAGCPQPKPANWYLGWLPTSPAVDSAGTAN